MDNRFNLLTAWLNDHLQTTEFTIVPIVGDASFRRYFRINCANDQWIAMDAPPEYENCQPFVAIAQAFTKHNIRVPQIIGHNLDQGFLLLSDLGDALYLQQLTTDTVDGLYANALQVLGRIQTCNEITGWTLPHFDQHFIHRELQLFHQWFLQQHLQLKLTPTIQKLLYTVEELLIQSALEQPQVCVHRDYHSRNLMRLTNNEVGVLDFQDAVIGPITYDAVSLLRDCYIDWPNNRVENWLKDFYLQVKAKDKLENCSFEQFLRWFDLIGLQRHLKVVGIFSRLKLRDAKPQYLGYFPRIFNYIQHVCSKYPELAEMQTFLNADVLAKVAL